MSGIKLNEHCSPDVRVVGNERTPVIVIDEPVIAIDSLQQAAAADGHFHVDRRFGYPGVRTRLPEDYVESMLPYLTTLLRDVYQVPDSFDAQLIHKLYSLITTPPEDLAILQRVPHFDDLSRWYFATVHYLSSGTHGGTGIFRHRPTGFERVSNNRYDDYVASAEAHMKANGFPAAEYITATTDHYELIEELEYKPNRIVIYPGDLLHSALVQPEADIDWNPDTGRLTANLFMNFVEFES